MTADAAFSSPPLNGGFLLKLDPTGALAYSTYTDAVDESGDERGGVGIGVDRGGKVYVAIEGAHRQPEVGLLRDRVRFAGARIRVFAPDGSVEDNDLFVPCGWSVFGFDGARRLVVAASRSFAAVTQGSLAARVPEPISVVKVDYGNDDAPKLESDIDKLDFNIIRIRPDQFVGLTKTINLKSSGDLNVPVSIAIIQ